MTKNNLDSSLSTVLYICTRIIIIYRNPMPSFSLINLYIFYYILVYHNSVVCDTKLLIIKIVLLNIFIIKKFFIFN